METIGKLRRRHLVKGESISAIARDLNLSRTPSRNTSMPKPILVKLGR